MNTLQKVNKVLLFRDSQTLPPKCLNITWSPPYLACVVKVIARGCVGVLDTSEPSPAVSIMVTLFIKIACNIQGPQLECQTEENTDLPFTTVWRDHCLFY